MRQPYIGDIGYQILDSLAQQIESDYNYVATHENNNKLRITHQDNQHIALIQIDDGYVYFTYDREFWTYQQFSLADQRCIDLVLALLSPSAIKRWATLAWELQQELQLAALHKLPKL